MANMFVSAGHVLRWPSSHQDYAIIYLPGISGPTKVHKFIRTSVPPLSTGLIPNNNRSYNFRVERRPDDGSLDIHEIQMLGFADNIVEGRIGANGIVQLRVVVNLGTLNENNLADASVIGSILYPSMNGPRPGEYHEVWAEIRTEGPLVYNDWVVVNGPPYVTDGHEPTHVCRAQLHNAADYLFAFPFIN